MSTLTTVAEQIARARQTDEGSFLPWRSFAELFAARVSDSRLATQSFLTYCDDDRRLLRTYSYGEFGARVRRTAAVLHHEVGLRRGDRLATVLFNHDATVVLYFAAWVSGIAVVPINLEESLDKIRYILDHSESSAVCGWHTRLDELVSVQCHLPTLRHVLSMNDHGVIKQTARRGNTRTLSAGHLLDRSSQACTLEDEALVVYTSGTTGPPKGVVLTVRNLLTDADAIADWHHFRVTDRLMCVLPIHHVNGMVVTLITPFYCQGSVVLNRKFKSGTFWRTLHDEHVTCVSVVPTLLEFLLDADEDLSRYRLDRLKGFICGAGPLLHDTAVRFEDRFDLPILHGYGLSETTCYSCFLPNELSREEHRHWLTEHEFPSIGMAIRHNVMTVLDDRGVSLPEMTRGEICIRGGTVCAGYLGRDDANEAAFRWGWFRSGDEGYYVKDRHGRALYFLSGRLKELIIRGGVNISPLEIDDVLKRHALVQFAMAVPFEHRYYGEEIAAYVVARGTATAVLEADLRNHCRQLLPFAKCPKVFFFGQDVPYTSTGKPKRLELKAQLAANLTAYRNTQFTED